MFGHEAGGPIVHSSKGFDVSRDDCRVITIASRGYEGSVIEFISTNVPITSVELVHDNGEKNWGKGAALFYCFVHLDGSGDAAWEGGAHS